MSASSAVAVRKSSGFTPPRFRFLLWVILLLFPLRALPAAEPTMTLLQRESQPISEGKTIIRSQYLYQPPAIAGVQLPATTVTKEIVVVGCGVNYDANRGVGQPRWVPSNGALAVTDRAGVAYQSTAGPLEFSLPVSADQALVVQKNGRAVSSRFVGAAAATAIKTDDRTARYLNVFPDTDLVWQAGNGYLKESLILRSRTAPTEFSFLLESPDFAFLASDASQSTFSLNEIRATAQATKVAGPLLLAPATAKQNHQILVPAPFVVDAHGKRSSLRCFVTRTPAGALLYTMRIPAGFLTARALTYPLTIDPGFYNVPSQGIPLTYESGVTYYIESAISYDESQNVRVEGNAFLKFAPGSYLAFSGNAVIDVQGTPYNYAYFTSANDNSVGEQTPGTGSPAPGDYESALQVSSRREGGVPNQCAIQYAKFAYAGEAIAVSDWYSEPPQTDGPYLLVEHSIFRDNQTAVAIVTENPGVGRKSDVNNCLLVGGGVSFYNSDGQERSHALSLTNCTLDHAGVGVTYGGPGNQFYVLRNVFKDTARVVVCSGYFGDGGTYQIDYNGRCGTHEDEWTEPRDLDPDAVHNLTETGNPFVSNANGSYYLNAQTIFRNAGSITAVAVGLSTRTTTAATADNGRVKQYDIGVAETWSPIARDDGAVDLGYHYEPVDIIIEPFNGEALRVRGWPGQGQGWVTVLPGVTVAFSRWYRLEVTDGGTLDVRGTGYQPIRFSSTVVCGDRIGDPWFVPGAGPLWEGFVIADTATSAAIEYCTFEHPAWALDLRKAIRRIEGCRFYNCGVGIYRGTLQGDPLTVKSCLFRNNATCIQYYDPVTVLNCTFYRAVSGIYGVVGSAAVRNCIFVENYYALFAYESYTLTESNNCFYGNAWNTRTEQGPGSVRNTDPQFSNTDAADLYERFYLDQTLSPCVDAGNEQDGAFKTTARDLRLDVNPVDIGYHYPGRGLVKVGKNLFFEFENGESFYPIVSQSMPHAFWDKQDRPDFYSQTIPAYLKCLAEHGVNMVMILPFYGSLRLQNHQYDPDREGTGEVKGYFREEGVQDYNKLFDAMDRQNLKYYMVTYDAGAYGPVVEPFYWSGFWPGYHRSGSGQVSNSVYIEQNDTEQYGWRGGSADFDTSGQFFVQSGRRPSDNRLLARDSFKGSLDEFLYSPYANPKWWTRDGLIGWEIFSEINWCLSSGYRWGESGVYDDPLYPSVGHNPDGATYLLNREVKVAEWATLMLDYIASGEQRNDRLGPRSRRLRWLDVGWLREFRNGQQPVQYLSVASNDFIDYHLYTWGANLETEKPNDPFSPLKYYLGVDEGLGTNGTLPKIIDYYRKTALPARGFFSTMYSLEGWKGDTTAMGLSKRLAYDCHHNYLWLTFATGSVGGPASWKFMGGMLPSATINFYDRKGDDTWRNPNEPREPLNYWTEEFLDSLLSLSRFTSLVRWKEVRAPASPSSPSPYRPMRETKGESGPGVSLRRSTNPADPEISESDYLWTGASDGYIAVGWIVRRHDPDYTKPERDDPLVPDTNRPWVHISGLASGTTLELVWFDDHKGKIVGPRPTTYNGSFIVQAPPTEPGGFGKSVAFLIQPYGFTPSPNFEELPNVGDIIGQIVVNNPTTYHDEHPWVYFDGPDTVLEAWTKPTISDPNNPNARYQFDWYFYWVISPNIQGYAGYRSGQRVNFPFVSPYWYYKVKLEIKDTQQGNKLVSGDIIFVDLSIP